MTRRDFHANLLLATSMLPGAPKPEQTRAYWYERIRRLGQTNLNEKDAATVDVEKWVRYWSSLKARRPDRQCRRHFGVLSNQSSSPPTIQLFGKSQRLW